MIEILQNVFTILLFLFLGVTLLLSNVHETTLSSYLHAGLRGEIHINTTNLTNEGLQIIQVNVESPPNLSEIIKNEKFKLHSSNFIEDFRDLPPWTITPHEELKYPDKVRPENLKEFLTNNNNNTKYPGVKFYKLSNINNSDLNISYYEEANIISTNHKYAILSAHQPRRYRPFTYIFSLPITCLAWIHIGYGCLVILPYKVKDLEVQEGIKLIKDTLSSYNNMIKGHVIILEIYVDEENRIAQFCQVVRMFAGVLLNKSLKIGDNYMYERNDILKSVYLITSDADLFPLNAQQYNDPSFDWLLTNPLRFGFKRMKIYMALSCVGAFLNVWLEIFDSQENASIEKNLTQSFSTKNLFKIIDNFKNKTILENDTGNEFQRIDWYMDQVFGGQLLINYIRKYGWKTIKTKNRSTSVTVKGRLDRTLIANDNWYSKLEILNNEQTFSDVHMCKAAFLSSCWWPLYFLLKSRLTKFQMDLLINYKFNFIELSVHNNYLGAGKIKQDLLIDEKIRQKYKKFYDTRIDWTEHSPKRFSKNVKPKYIDWENERLFKYTDENRDAYYYVVPAKYPLFDVESKFTKENEIFLI